ncbi:MAG TPA: DUF305 domain-containing protein [Alphaproteobacteria bacterium]|nr:DUF305 domain-containing protein [Alphaproteobacteria bacterium]
MRKIIAGVGIVTMAGVWGMQNAVAVEDDGSIRDFKAVESAMQAHDKQVYTGNADVDFRRRLIVKRQGIIDMAEVAMAHAKDPQTEALARKVIANQRRDIAEMQQWLKSTHVE